MNINATTIITILVERLKLSNYLRSPSKIKAPLGSKTKENSKTVRK